MNDTISQMLIYLPFGIIFIIVFICLCRLYSDKRADAEFETEIKRDKERIDKFTDAVKHSTDSVAECEGTTERITEVERRADIKISVASESVAEAKHSGNRIEQLADECLSILEEAEKTSKQS